ncbi:hypothetical protein FGO68_gene12370 [Halteria grandinella]|uniref:Uncharacterized protein n=1 Tax=Halteria grandinella TaxID=5974 RepID=A0A8J8TAS4_HALGN|nr:hypothetical protein FGO68_gene12370 [Halteria grandinella]
MLCDVEYSNNMFNNNTQKKDTNVMSDIFGGGHNQRLFKSANKNEPSDQVNDHLGIIGEDLKSRAINAILYLTYQTCPAPITRSGEPQQSASNIGGIESLKASPIKARCITRNEFTNLSRRLKRVEVEQQDVQSIEDNHQQQVSSLAQPSHLSEQQPYIYLFRLVSLTIHSNPFHIGARLFAPHASLFLEISSAYRVIRSSATGPPSISDIPWAKNRGAAEDKAEINCPWVVAIIKYSGH